MRRPRLRPTAWSRLERLRFEPSDDLLVCVQDDGGWVHGFFRSREDAIEMLSARLPMLPAWRRVNRVWTIVTPTTRTHVAFIGGRVWVAEPRRFGRGRASRPTIWDRLLGDGGVP